ncbi:unnamed protein product [Taphrina deformans PYCC 5710]|uniref:tripeptidyl-peptidase II n=1 Tax=Taphrina deformans (strain PYCC 5710 / ATCC 11124 / CBS 356.35 / IMI 108563 / JCM 9778 / NBRC 8474) TaxID=1097556 RepID=R4XG80_TAPDE|nr:unnamed protein product [Taphrina deformans PYCC 5710]|eukprot:CCG84906.1 unnamed protein product [Taphrina deformans PYCC 5710]
MWSPTVVLTLYGLLATVYAHPRPTENHVLHERRDSLPAGWSHKGDSNKDARFRLKIALTQQNTDNLEAIVMEVSDPTSPKYGKYYTHQEISKLFEPTEESRAAVTSWLLSAGISLGQIKISPSKGWIHVDASIAEAERLLKNQYDVYEHKNGHLVARSEVYHVPSNLAEHIDIITPTIDFDMNLAHQKPSPEIIKRTSDIIVASKQSGVKDVKTIYNSRKPHGPKSQFLHFGDQKDEVFNPKLTLDNCEQYMTPKCLFKLYNVPPLIPDAAKYNGSLGIYTQSPEAYLQDDLDYYNSLANPWIPKGTSPIVQTIDSFGPQTAFQGQSYNLEANLDTQVSIPLMYPANVTVYQVGDNMGGGNQNTFLDGIDATYCLSNGEAEVLVDPVYPSPDWAGYRKRDCGTVKPASVISFSYGGFETLMQTEKYSRRQCTEWGKMGATGVSFLGSSGDDGVSIAHCGLYDPPVTEAQKRFVVNWPSACPWFTSVGSTELKPGKKVWQTNNERAPNVTTQSGGGFSNLFPRPVYQKAALETYFRDHAPTKAAGRYNATGTRGYPDVAAIGVNYLTSVNHHLVQASGSSVASPIVASLIARLNILRQSRGKPVLGFLNPALYANAHAFNDVVEGSNPGCHGVGFDAVPGWDPVTGLGSVNWEKLAAALG